MKIAVVTDSASDLPPDLAAARKIMVVPQHVIWGQDNYADGVDITPQVFYERLARDPVNPKTSQPSPGEFAAKYREAIAANSADGVLCITVSSKLSGTYSSACTARDLMDFPVEVVDSRVATMAQCLTVLSAADACDHGLSMEEVINVAQNAAGRAQFLFTLNTLEFLHRGGRIGAAQRLIGTALSIKPILGLKDGIVVPVETVRTRKKAIDRLLEMASRYADKRPIWVGIIHSNTPELADFQREIQARLKPDLMVTTLTSSAVGVYAGPGAIGLGILAGQ